LSANRGARGEIADIARQARSLLELVRESRWPGFEPTPAAPTVIEPPATRPPHEPYTWGSLEQIAEAVGSCTKCSLHATRTHTVPGEGAPKSEG
jgi:hypothetical protein